MQRPQTWRLLAVRVIKNSETVGLDCDLTVSIALGEKYVHLEAETTQMEYRVKNIKVSCPSPRDPHLAFMLSDGLKITFDIRIPAVQVALREISTALDACRTADRPRSVLNGGVTLGSVLGSIAPRGGPDQPKRTLSTSRQSKEGASPVALLSSPSKSFNHKPSVGGKQPTRQNQDSTNVEVNDATDPKTSTPKLVPRNTLGSFFKPSQCNAGSYRRNTNDPEAVVSECTQTESKQLSPQSGRNGLTSKLDPFADYWGDGRGATEVDAPPEGGDEERRYQSPLRPGGHRYRGQSAIGLMLSASRERRLSAPAPTCSLSLLSPKNNNPFASPATGSSVLNRIKLHTFFSRSDSCSGLTTTTKSRFQGISNMGNTCYMNSVVQGLLAVPEVLSALQRSELVGKHGEGRWRRPLMSALADIAVLQKVENHGVLSALSLKKAIDSYCGEQFRLNEQHDGHEFLSAFLEIVHEEELGRGPRGTERSDGGAGWALEQNISPNTSPPRDVDTEPVAETAGRTPGSPAARSTFPPVMTTKKRSLSEVEGMEVGGQRGEADRKRLKNLTQSEAVEQLVDRRGMGELFCSSVRNNILCKSCGRSRTKEEEYRDFSLEIDQSGAGEGQGCSLEKLLERFFSAEDRELSCEFCRDSAAVARVQATLSALPEVLIIHFKRFRFDRQSFSLKKTNVDVRYSIELDMSAFWNRPLPLGQAGSGNSNSDSDDSGSCKYQLRSVIRHCGENALHGHYVCDALRGEGVASSWERCDDSVVSKISQDDVLKSTGTPYILFYVRDSSRK